MTFNCLYRFLRNIFQKLCLMLNLIFRVARSRRPSFVQKFSTLTQGHQIQIWLGGGGLCPRILQLLGGNIAPEFSIIGGQKFENPNKSSA